MTSQDGFTLMDLVSYNYKHNEANGEDNNDGSSYNFSWNCGVEGPSRKTAVRQMREKQVRNAFLFMLLSQGVPMLYGGDEFGNSQEGNNNAYCQDNAVGWLPEKYRYLSICKSCHSLSQGAPHSPHRQGIAGRGL